MSSHHIVRDEQEPALILANLTGVPWEPIGNLLEWAPVVVCLESALDGAMDMGFHLDWVVVEQKEKWLASIQLHHPHVMEASADTAISRTIERLQAKDHREAHLVCENWQLYRSEWLALKHFQLIIVDVKARWHRVDEHFEKWLPAGVKLWIVPNEGPVEVTGTHNERLSAGHVHEINIKKEGRVSFRQPGTFFLGQAFES